MSRPRDDVLAEVASAVPDPGRRVRVGIDGVDGAGKTTFADELAVALRARGREVVRTSIDGFHCPRAQRYARGRDSPRGFFEDSYDHERFRAEVLDPFGPGGDGRHRTAIHDVGTDTSPDLPPQQAGPRAALLVDGIFLHRAELVDAWDLTVFLDVPFTVSVDRMAARDLASADHASPDPGHPSHRRYVRGQRQYLAECDPVRRADVVVDNTDLEHPVVVRVRDHDAGAQADGR